MTDYATHQGYLVEGRPAASAAAITPNDSADLSNVTRGIYVGGGGNVKVDMNDTGTAVVFYNVPVGVVLPIRAARVYSTGTTATNLVALY
jgi:hypothetical protein